MNAHLSEDDRAALLEEIPANRFGSPEDVAAALLSVVNGSSYMTGQVISVDGGWI
jgi:3-oxoacyl-[acyl-carrier protein] reductase